MHVSTIVIVSIFSALYADHNGSSDRVAVSLPDTLDAQSKQRVLELRAQMARIGRQVDEAWKRACAEDRMLTRARDEKWAASNGHAHAQGSLFDRIAKLKAETPNLADEITIWRDLCGSIYAHSTLQQELAADADVRPFVVWSAHYWLTHIPHDDLPDEIKKHIPNPDNKLTPQQAWRIVASASVDATNQQESRKMLAGLEEKLKEVRLPRKELKEYRRAYAVNELLKHYIRENKPDYVKNARIELQKLGNELSTIWPDWRNAAEVKQDK